MTVAEMGQVTSTAGDLSTFGDWEVLPYDSQIEAVHMALLHPGKVLYYSGFRVAEAIETETRLWYPKTGEIKAPNTPADLFCAGHSFLPDGRLLSSGGSLEYRGLPSFPPWLVKLLRPVTPFLARIAERYLADLKIFRNRHLVVTGPTFLYIFDPSTERWEFAGDMPEGRWYPTNTSLPDGRILILSGRNEGGGFGARVPAKTNMRVEVFEAGRGLEQVAVIPEMDHDSDDDDRHHLFPSLYPRMHVLPLSDDDQERYPQGKAFCSGYGPETKILDLATWEWEDIDNLTEGSRHDGCSVLLPLRPPDYKAKVLTFGGSTRPGGREIVFNSAEVIDLSMTGATWKKVASMRHPRVHAASVLLPDGKVLAAGGTRTGRFDKAVLEVEVFDPDTEKWSAVNSMRVPRGYHATAILLPDGRVLMSGTTPFHKHELRMEVYKPYYLYRGIRPEIITSPEAIKYADPFEISYKCEEGEVFAAVLIRPGAMTHAFDMEQRYVELRILEKREDYLSVDGPKDQYLAPPGYYMLFLIRTNDLPSVAEFILLH